MQACTGSSGTRASQCGNVTLSLHGNCHTFQPSVQVGGFTPLPLPCSSSISARDVDTAANAQRPWALHSSLSAMYLDDIFMACVRDLGTEERGLWLCMPMAGLWALQVVGEGRCHVVDTYWQTETGAHMIAPLPGLTKLKPGSATLPFFGVEPAILDEQGREVEGEGEGCEPCLPTPLLQCAQQSRLVLCSKCMACVLHISGSCRIFS